MLEYCIPYVTLTFFVLVLSCTDTAKEPGTASVSALAANLTPVFKGPDTLLCTHGQYMVNIIAYPQQRKVNGMHDSKISISIADSIEVMKTIEITRHDIEKGFTAGPQFLQNDVLQDIAFEQVICDPFTVVLRAKIGVPGTDNNRSVLVNMLTDGTYTLAADTVSAH